MYAAGMTLLFSIFFSWADPVPTDPLEPHCQSVALEKGLQEKRARTGEEVYKEVCGVCHGVDAQGTDVFPTLIDTQWVKDDYVLAQIILRGVVGEIFVKGQRYASAMPGFHEELSDKDILGVVQYLCCLQLLRSASSAGGLEPDRSRPGGPRWVLVQGPLFARARRFSTFSMSFSRCQKELAGAPARTSHDE